VAEHHGSQYSTVQYSTVTSHHHIIYNFIFQHKQCKMLKAFNILVKTAVATDKVNIFGLCSEALTHRFGSGWSVGQEAVTRQNQAVGCYPIMGATWLREVMKNASVTLYL
jgi:hypothetical protein